MDTDHTSEAAAIHQSFSRRAFILRDWRTSRPKHAANNYDFNSKSVSGSIGLYYQNDKSVFSIPVLRRYSHHGVAQNFGSFFLYFLCFTSFKTYFRAIIYWLSQRTVVTNQIKGGKLG